MNITDIKEIARQFNVKVGKTTKSELVQSIQQAEGNQLCFSNNVSACGRHSGLWREDCD